MKYLARLAFFILLLPAVFSAGLAGCEKKSPALIVLSGKGMKNAIEEIAAEFEKEFNIPVSLVFAGSNSLLKTIQDTRQGDIYVAGSRSYIRRLKDHNLNERYLVKHKPALVVHKLNPKKIYSYFDLDKAGISIAIGNKDMAAIGRVSEKIVSKSANQINFQDNVVVKSSTVIELLDLVANGKVDAAIVWEDMITWKQSENLQIIPIPQALNEVNEIWVSQLAFSSNKELSRKFFDYVRTRGIPIFEKHGFVQ